MSDSRTVKEFIVEEFAPGVDPNQLADDYDLLAHGIVDSLGLLRLVTWLGTRYGFDPDDVGLAEDDFRTVAAIRGFVDRATSGDPEGAR